MKAVMIAILLLCTACTTPSAETKPQTEAVTQVQDTARTETKTEIQTEDITEESTETEIKEATETETEAEAAVPQETDNTEVAAVPDLTVKDELQSYLKGNWTMNLRHISDYTSELVITDDLHYTLQFTDASGQAGERFTGTIEPTNKRQDDPDVVIRFADSKGGPSPEFYLAHRTDYENKRVMGLYHVKEETGPFAILSPDPEHFPRELLYEQEAEERETEEAQANAEFFGVYWSTGELPATLWVDPVEVDTEPKPRGDTYATSPYHNYTDSNPGSILFTVRAESAPQVLGETRLPGSLFVIRTDEKGAIREMTPYTLP